MKYLKLSLLLAVLISFSSCGDDDEASLMEPAERIVGTWNVNSIVIFGITTPDGGSTIEFKKCGTSECNGTSYDSSEEVSGDFTYILNTDGTSLTIDVNGGISELEGEWKVTDFTHNSLKLTQSSVLGEIGFVLGK